MFFRWGILNILNHLIKFTPILGDCKNFSEARNEAKEKQSKCNKAIKNFQSDLKQLKPERNDKKTLKKLKVKKYSPKVKKERKKLKKKIKKLEISSQNDYNSTVKKSAIKCGLSIASWPIYYSLAPVLKPLPASLISSGTLPIQEHLFAEKSNMKSLSKDIVKNSCQATAVFHVSNFASDLINKVGSILI